MNKQEYRQKKLIQIYESRQANIVRSESNLCLLAIGADFLLFGAAYSLLGIITSFALIPLFVVVGAAALALADEWRRRELNKLTEKINQVCDREGIEHFL